MRFYVFISTKSENKISIGIIFIKSLELNSKKKQIKAKIYYFSEVKIRSNSNLRKIYDFQKYLIIKKCYNNE